MRTGRKPRILSRHEPSLTELSPPAGTERIPEGFARLLIANRDGVREAVAVGFPIDLAKVVHASANKTFAADRSARLVAL
jgi:hypothetical protein